MNTIKNSLLYLSIYSLRLLCIFISELDYGLKQLSHITYQYANVTSFPGNFVQALLSVLLLLFSFSWLHSPYKQLQLPLCRLSHLL